MNSLQSTGSCSLNVFKAIVKEHNTVCRHADCPDNVVVRLGFGLSQPNRRRHVDLFEIAEKAGKLLRPVLLVFAVGIGKGVQREASRRFGQQFRDAGHLSDKDGVPPFK